MSTSKLQKETSRILEQYFSEITIRENHRPDWMMSRDGKRLELDFFLEEIDVAIEVQGDQHYRYVEFFHGNSDGFQERLEDDAEKKRICKKRGVRLFEISSDSDLVELVKILRREARYKFSLTEGHYEQRMMRVLLDRDSPLVSKIYIAVWYMYFHFIDYGTLYPTENKALHDFYLRYKKEIDEKLNFRLKSADTERRVKNRNMLAGREQKRK